MSRRPRDEAAAALAVEELRRVPPGGPALVLEDPRPDVAETLREGGAETATWSRWGPAAPWPPAGSRDTVALRLPRSRQELEMLLHMAAGALRPGGRLLVYGANDEGVKSVPRRLEPLFDHVATLSTGGHARLVGARRRDAPPSTRAASVDAWRETFDVTLPGTEAARRWVSYPGVFAHGRLDDGTALLLTALPVVGAGARVLDYGAGTGFLAAGVLDAAPGARVTALEPDGLAAEACRENVPGAEVVVGAGWAALEGRGTWDVVVSNPPYHRGKEETLAEIDAFLEGLRSALSPGGIARCVTQRRLPFAERAGARGWAKVRPVAEGGAFRVWELTR